MVNNERLEGARTGIAFASRYVEIDVQLELKAVCLVTFVAFAVRAFYAYLVNCYQWVLSLLLGKLVFRRK